MQSLKKIHAWAQMKVPLYHMIRRMIGVLKYEGHPISSGNGLISQLLLL